MDINTSLEHLREALHAPTARASWQRLSAIEREEDGTASGEIRPVHAEPYLFFTSIAGAILFTVATIPTMVEQYPDAPRGDDAADRLERDAVAMAQRLLGLSEPQPV